MDTLEWMFSRVPLPPFSDSKEVAVGPFDTYFAVIGNFFMSLLLIDSRRSLSWISFVCVWIGFCWMFTSFSWLPGVTCMFDEISFGLGGPLLTSSWILPLVFLRSVPILDILLMSRPWFWSNIKVYGVRLPCWSPVRIIFLWLRLWSPASFGFWGICWSGRAFFALLAFASTSSFERCAEDANSSLSDEPFWFRFLPGDGLSSLTSLFSTVPFS